MLPEPTFQFIQSPGQIRMGANHLPEPDKGPHDLDIDDSGLGTAYY